MKRKLTDRINDALFRGLFHGISLMPFRPLYAVSDSLAWIMHRVVKYRLKVVKSNLSSSFPDKTPEEIDRIAKKFYHFLSDYFVETVKLSSMSRKQIMRRMTFEGIEPVAKALEEGRSVSLYLGHYCNWEWVSSLPIYFPENVKCGQIYHPLENSSADKTFLRLRSRFGATSIRMQDSLKVLMRWNKEGIPSVTGYISDQVPGYNGIHCWVDFLNHDTPVFSGTERISRMLHAEVYYIDMFRRKRGYYTGRFVKMADDATRCDRFSLTKTYFDLLEQSIKRAPEFWLWSHRRWKRTREDFMKRFPDAQKRLTHL